MKYKLSTLFVSTFILLFNACKCKYTCDVNTFTERKLENYAKDSLIVFETLNGKKISFKLKENINTGSFETGGKSHLMSGCYLEPECFSELSYTYKSDSIFNGKNEIEYNVTIKTSTTMHSDPEVNFRFMDFWLIEPVIFVSDSVRPRNNKIVRIYDTILGGKQYSVLFKYQRTMAANERVANLYFSPDSGFVAFTDVINNSFYIKK